MSSESDSDLFYDAEDTTPVRTTKVKDKSIKPDAKCADIPEPTTSQLELLSSQCSVDDSNTIFPIIQVNQEDIKEAERKVKESEKRRRKVEELRNKLKDDDDALEIPSEQSSLASSVDGIYPGNVALQSGKTVLANSEESRSVLSLGNVGSILGGKTKDFDAISMDSKYSLTETATISDWNSSSFLASSTMLSCQEPDLVASTKGERSSATMPRPVVPPRKKRKNKAPPIALTPKDCLEPQDIAQLPTPTDPVENLTRELECCSLDLQSATRGQYVVKPQDREQDRVVGPESQSLVVPASLDDAGAFEAGSDKTATKNEGEISQPYMVRTRTDSGRPLTDQEILEQVKVVNLDTGEQIPLSLAEEHLPKCLNPLSLHIMRLTSEYVSNTALDKERESDEESIDSKKTNSIAGRKFSRYKGIGKLIGRNIENSVNKLRTVVADRVHHTRHGDEDASDEDGIPDSRSNIEVKISSKLKSVDKGHSEFEKIRVVQELSGEHIGAIWTMKFSSCGRLLATAGQDHDLRIWVLRGSFKYFNDMRLKYSTEGKSSPTPSQDSFVSASATENVKNEESNGDTKGPFVEVPFCRYRGHTAELLDVSWSKNYFILSSSMDKTVRLWHISRPECLCCFQHIDFVTAIAFHPRDDRYFLSGSLDGKLRLWNIPDKKVTLWHELEGQTKLITAVNFCRNGKIAVVGSYEGRCIFYHTEQLKYHTQIHVRSSRGKNKQGRKISGIEAMPGEDKILVTSNDSRIRLYDLRDLSLSCKYKGYVNLSSQIKASFSHDGRYIISGSENQYIYIWKTFHDYVKSSRRDRNDYWERIKAHNAVVTSAVFSPKPSMILEQLENESSSDVGAPSCYVIVSADFCGTIKVFLHKSRAGATDVS